MLLHFTLEGEKGLGLCLPGPPPCWVANALQRVKERLLWGLSGPLAGAWLGGAEDAPSSLMPSLGGGCGAQEPDRGPGTWFYASPQCGPALAAVPRPCQTPEAAEGLGALNVRWAPQWVSQEAPSEPSRQWPSPVLVIRVCHCDMAHGLG